MTVLWVTWQLAKPVILYYIVWYGMVFNQNTSEAYCKIIKRINICILTKNIRFPTCNGKLLLLSIYYVQYVHVVWITITAWLQVALISRRKGMPFWPFRETAHLSSMARGNLRNFNYPLHKNHPCDPTTETFQNQCCCLFVQVRGLKHRKPIRINIAMTIGLRLDQKHWPLFCMGRN